MSFTVQYADMKGKVWDSEERSVSGVPPSGGPITAEWVSSQAWKNLPEGLLVYKIYSNLTGEEIYNWDDNSMCSSCVDRHRKLVEQRK